MKQRLRSDSFTHTLPHELIEEILLRLPVRSLLRFKCVCKSWLTLISNPQFAKSHFDIAAAPTHRLLVKPTHGVPLESIEIETPLHDDPVPLRLTPPPSSLFPSLCPSYLQILGSCRGLILLSYIQEDDLILWNPSTGARKTISCSPVRILFYGFVYDTSTDDYLVVLVIKEHWSDLKADIELFSLKTNSWNKIKGINFPYSMTGMPWHQFISGLFLNGAIHWLTLRKGTVTDDVMIIAFDVMERSLSEIPLPNYITFASRSISVLDICHFMVIGGCLALCCSHPCGCWVMKEYKVQSSWTKSNVSSNQRTGCFPDFPICLSIGGGIVGSHAIGKSMELGDKGGFPKLSEFIFKRFCIFLLLQSAVYTESLQSFPSDFGEASKHDKQ